MKPHDAPVLRTEDITVPPGHLVRKIPIFGAAVGVIGLIGAYATAGGTRPFAFSWLFAMLFFLSLALGALYFVLIHFATQAAWGIVVRRLGENVASAIPVLAVLFLPVLALRAELFPWIKELAQGHDALILKKAPYLNEPFFLTRAVIYFVLWTGIAFAWATWSRKQDATGDIALSRRMRNLAGPAIIVVALSQTFSAFDWLMSLDPGWYSTMFGVYWFAGSFVSFFALLILLVVRLRSLGLLKETITLEHFHDLGKMLFAFTVFWAYIGFSQYFLIWYGNIPEETIFFRHRLHGSWSGASFLLAAGHFVIPFFFLMPRTIKRKPGWLAVGAAWVLAMHLLDLDWLILPNLSPGGFRLGVSDVLALLAVGGFFAAWVSWRMAGAPLVPVKDPRLPESLSFENV